MGQPPGTASAGRDLDVDDAHPAVPAAGAQGPAPVAKRQHCEVWSCDITRLRTMEKWVYLYLYVVLDIFSRAVVGWMVAEKEAAALASRLIEETSAKPDVRPGTLVLHGDRGTQMPSKTLAQMLAELDIGASHSRPQVSDDNPFSESQFKTMKYHSSFPGKFTNSVDAVTFGRTFFTGTTTNIATVASRP